MFMKHHREHPKSYGLGLDLFFPSTYGDFVSFVLQKHLCRIPSTFFFVAQKQTLPPTTILPSGHPMSTTAVPLMHYCSLAVTQVLLNYCSLAVTQV
jgi:hypothetical protein